MTILGLEKRIIVQPPTFRAIAPSFVYHFCTAPSPAIIKGQVLIIGGGVFANPVQGNTIKADISNDNAYISFLALSHFDF